MIKPIFHELNRHKGIPDVPVTSNRAHLCFDMRVHTGCGVLLVLRPKMLYLSEMNIIPLVRSHYKLFGNAFPKMETDNIPPPPLVFPSGVVVGAAVVKISGSCSSLPNMICSKVDSNLQLLYCYCGICLNISLS